MFKWKDYEENSALFIDGITENVAILNQKTFQLTDAATGYKQKIKSSCLDEAKVDAENFLKLYWNNVKRNIDKQLEMLSK